MEIEVIASSSKGNCYIVRGEGQTMLLDAGLPIRQINQALGFKLPNICFVSHVHMDHARAAADLARLGVTMLMSTETSTELGIYGQNIRNVKHGDQIIIREWILTFFATEHDCPGSLGVIMSHLETRKRILFATDTCFIRYKISMLNVLLIECNYANDLLWAHDMPSNLRERIISSHFELNRVKEFIRSNDMSQAERIILLHLSDTNSDAERFKSEVYSVAGVPVDVAAPGLKIKL